MAKSDGHSNRFLHVMDPGAKSTLPAFDKLIEGLSKSVVQVTCNFCHRTYGLPFAAFPRPCWHLVETDGKLTIQIKFTGAILCSKCAPPNGRIEYKREVESCETGCEENSDSKDPGPGQSDG